MSHNPASKQSVPLDTLAGLVTNIGPENLPAGASSWVEDMDYVTGSTFTRAGKKNVYAFAGASVGPNGGTHAVDVPSSGAIWQNPTNVLNDDGSVASVAVGGSGSSTATPTTGTDSGSSTSGGSNPWTNPNNITSASSLATITLTQTVTPPPPTPPPPPVPPPQPPFPRPPSGGGHPAPNLDPIESNLILAGQFNFNLPTSANVVGIILSMNAFASGTAVPSVQLQMTSNGVAVGNQQVVNITSTPTVYTFGAANDVLGTSLTSAGVNGTAFGVQVQATLTGDPPMSSSFSVNNLSVTLVYTTPAFADPLRVTGFNFNVSSTSGVTGIIATVKGFQSGAGDLSLQLMKNNVPVGEPKVIVQNSTNTAISVGADHDTWDTDWTFNDINNLNFGIQITSEGLATQNIDFISLAIAQSTSLENFNYVKTFAQSKGSVYTEALDAGGVLWQEDVVNNPGVLTNILETITPGTFMNSVTLDDYEYMMFHNRQNGTDIPLQYNGSWFDRLSQSGPGAPPTFQASLGAAAQATITAWSITSNVVTITAANSFTAGEVVTISGLVTGSFLNGLAFSILGTGLSGSQFQVAFVHANTSASEGGVATPQFGYPIANITQNPAKSDPGDAGFFQQLLWSSGPGTKEAGSVITVYYANATEGKPQDATLVAAFNNNPTVYVYIANAPFGTGTRAVTSIGSGKPPGADGVRWYFTVQADSSNSQYFGSAPDKATGTYQLTVATLATTVPIPNLSVGDQVVITGNSASGWNSTWSITKTLNSGFFNITNTSMLAGVATYTWSLVSGVGPTAGQQVTIVQTLNGNGIFNVTDAVIATVVGTTSGTFTISGFPSTNIGSAPESGQAQTSGTQFQFDPGLKTLGTQTSPINGSGTGGLATLVGSTQSIGAGTRQAVVFFETRNGLKTQCSTPVTFTTGLAANFIESTNVPIGPPNVVRRWIAFTGAGANGQPGPNFYTIDNPVSFTVNNQNFLYTPTYIDDNITTTAKFVFTDAILLAGDEIDVQGQNLFSQIELGSSAWAISYANRLFVGGEQNKVLNFNNMSFDGGYLPNPVGNLSPLGWGIDATSNVLAGNAVNITSYQITSNIVTFSASNNFFAGQVVFIAGLAVGTFLNSQTLTVLLTGLSSTQFQCAFTHANAGLTADTGTATPLQEGATLLESPIFGNSYYINNQLGSTQSTLGMIVQSAYQDAYNVPILLPNVKYSVRVTARIPSGITVGNLVVDLTDYNVGLISGTISPTGYGGGYGSFTIPFASMNGTMQTFTGALLSNAFTTGVPAGLLLRLYAQNIGYGADVEIDRIEIFPTNAPVNTTNIRVSYVDNFEAFDAVTGNLGLSAISQGAAMGAFTLHDALYFMQTSAMQSTQDVPGVEPSGPHGGWALHEVSNRVGTCGINAYDYGEEWVVTACRNGIYGFNGGQPVRIDFQQKEIWEAINWEAGNTICLRNDLANRRILVAIPLPTPNKWMPLAPVNAAPTSPNVIMLLNYEGLGSFEALVSGQAIHVTMFGTLMATDMRIKCSLWNIKTPYMGFVTTDNLTSQELQICNGEHNSKIYRLDPNQINDDGVPILWVYSTYGFVDAAKAEQMPLLGLHRKRYQGIQFLVSDGIGTMDLKAYQNYILNPDTLALNPQGYVVPGGVALQTEFEGELWRPLNTAGNRLFIVFQGDRSHTSAVNVSSMTLVGTIDKFSQINPNLG